MSLTPQVEKAIPVAYDLGNLAVADSNPLEINKAQLEQSLQATTRDNVQLLINQVLQLPVKRTADSINSSSTQDSSMVLFQLPRPVWITPREKPLPKPKAKTKWQEFAEKKGIKKQKQEGKLVYDEDAQKWVPKWGFNGANKKLDDQWLVEVDDKKANTEEELIDPRKLAREDRKKLVKKNFLQQKKNAQRAAGK